MALTARGKELTEAHRKAQIAIAARAEIVGRALWSGLDIDDLDRSTPAWLNANVAATRKFYAESAALAAAYVPEYRAAELGSAAGSIVEPEFETAVMRNTLLVAGPVRVKTLIKSGTRSGSAYSGALMKYSGMMRRQVLSGGRMMIHETTSADRNAVGWRRVTDGDPCTFCAMLASRGPVYGSRSVQGDVLRPLREGGSGLRYHGYCGCTAEIIYGEWQPSESEQRYIEEYEKAAQEAEDAGLPRVEETVLHRMRNNGVFRDSPLSRNK